MVIITYCLILQDCPGPLVPRHARHVELESVSRVKMFVIVTTAYVIFWGPLFLTTLANYKDDWKEARKSMAHEVAKIYQLNLASYQKALFSNISHL